VCTGLESIGRLGHGILGDEEAFPALDAELGDCGEIRSQNLVPDLVLASTVSETTSFSNRAVKRDYCVHCETTRAELAAEISPRNFCLRDTMYS
jgi:hypothetical protein